MKGFIKIAAVLACMVPGLGWAETSPEEPEVEKLVEPVELAMISGRFAGAANARDIDEIAALEQQAWREFRWDVIEPAQLDLAIAFRDLSLPKDWPTDLTFADDWASGRLLISEDGERFIPLDADAVVQPGQVVSVLMKQRQAELEDSTRFFPSNWSFTLSGLPVDPVVGAAFGPILMPISFGDDLGCETPGCGEEFVPAKLPGLNGTPGETSAAKDPVQSNDADQDLARTLQGELARVGCYTIAIDGLWGPGSRKAMAAFNAATGANLSVETPAPAALVAVAQQTGKVCP